MSEHDQKVARINELARKSKSVGLNDDEKTEQHSLRRWYIDACKASLQGHLENIRYVDDQGNTTKPQG
ncbi:MAG: DUF896 domain-containing protein [Candidatus Sericytochromatia bacterium]